MNAKRWNRAGSCWLLMCWAFWLQASAGAAEPLPAGEATALEVDELVARGIELRKAGQDARALLLFEAAFEKAPASARVAVHLATTHQALGQWLEADRYLRQSLQETADPYVQRHRATLEKAQEFVDRHLGSLDVMGEPTGAEVRLSGQRLGTLPLTEPARVPVGSYELEVQKPGHYSVKRPISISGRAFVREYVSLAAKGSTLVLAPAPAHEAAALGDPQVASLRWLTWTLAGAGASAALMSGIALAIREQHAARWNGDGCLAADLTRGQVCSGELEAGRTAENVGIASGILSGLLLGGALTSYLLEARNEELPVTAVRCGVGWASAGCSGAF